MTSYLGKTYKYEKSENIREFLEHCGASAEQVDNFLALAPTQKLEKNGDQYTQTTVDYKTTVLTFKDGVEFEETIVDGIVAKTTVTVGADVVTQVQKFDSGRVVTHKKTYKPNELVVEMTASTWDGKATRWFAAA